MKFNPCKCDAYPFPHQPDKGACTGWLEYAFDKETSCFTCPNYIVTRESHGIPGGLTENTVDCKGPSSPASCPFYVRR